MRIQGAVARPIELQAPELAALADTEVVADFRCHEGWSRVGVRWRGVRLAALLSLAGASDGAGYVTVASGDYTVVLSREQAEDRRVLLALERDGRPLRVADGVPRLVGPADWDCFTSVKAVQRIEVTREPAEATAARIALGRLEGG
jgi:DMSO/TMAO reductase YedYZ molybdopterin-dependent catalytic subunit